MSRMDWVRIASIVALMSSLGSLGQAPDWLSIPAILVTLPVWAWLHRP